ncbi:MAG: CHAD domain-containing protein [Candidatus Pedobacter colombiensis]|uniref:CHAD domain-containing protein n=1 Tax=Candidatus Pedobacter colombiensis TaxID=3121371 RepID=A0AAJ6B7F4_9SPHI|nr:CHAD domain-containing protein [Pedobacter sp.]WEK21047.1 MAG: CHAD domain-containing protein [Pedobacter sp.]
MKRKRVKWYLEKRMAYIEKYAKLILAGGDKEAIHQLRIGFKKLRAFLRLAGLKSSAEKRPMIPSELKQIYRYTGKVRDLQLYYHNIFPFYHKADSYPHQVLHQIAVAKGTLLTVLKDFRFYKATKRMKKKAPDGVSKRILDKFIQKKTVAIGKLTGGNIQNGRLHVLKKYLKDVSYTLKVFHTRARKYFPIAGKVNRHELDELSNILNEYLDCVVGLTLLNEALSGDLSADDADILKKIKKEWIIKKARTRRLAMVMLPGILQN